MGSNWPFSSHFGEFSAILWWSKRNTTKRFSKTCKWKETVLNHTIISIFEPTSYKNRSHLSGGGVGQAQVLDKGGGRYSQKYSSAIHQSLFQKRPNCFYFLRNKNKRKRRQFWHCAAAGKHTPHVVAGFILSFFLSCGSCPCGSSSLAVPAVPAVPAEAGLLQG